MKDLQCSKGICTVTLHYQGHSKFRQAGGHFIIVSPRTYILPKLKD